MLLVSATIVGDAVLWFLSFAVSVSLSHRLRFVVCFHRCRFAACSCVACRFVAQEDFARSRQLKPKSLKGSGCNNF